MRYSLFVISLAVVVGGAAGALAALATFDSFTEGYFATQIVDDGIRFFDLDRRMGDPEYFFTIERADGSGLTAWPEFFSPPNVLGLGGWAPGPDVGFSRCGEFKFSIDQVATEARAEFFTFLCHIGNTVTMEAWLGGEIVASDSFTFTTFALEHHTLEIVDVAFDTIRINGTGQDQGAFFAVVDNVYVTGAVATDQATWGSVKSLFK